MRGIALRSLCRTGMRAFMLIVTVLLALNLAAAQGGLRLHGSVAEGQVRVDGRPEDAAEVAVRAIWRFTDDGIVFDLESSTGSDDRGLALDRLVEAGLGAFLDAHIRFDRDGVKADDTPDRLLNLMNAMAWAAEEHFHASGTFAGFEAPTRDQLIRLCAIDWSQATKAVVTDEQDKYLAIHFFLRTQRQELERQLRADLLPLSVIDVLAPIEPEQSAGQRERINSVCGTVYDADNFLCALDLSVSDSSLRMDEATLNAQVMAALRERPVPSGENDAPRAVPGGGQVRKRDRWLKAELDAINARIDRADQRQELWELRDRIDDLQGQMEDLRVRVEEQERAPEGAEDERNPIAELSALTGHNVTVRFERYAVDIAPEYLLVLNEVFEQLARSPEERVLITGYTDRSGDPAANLRLSEARAKAVRDHLLQRGIAPERLLVNFYGDSRSEGRDPGERRVEIEWLR